MRTLLLLRHAKSSWDDPALDDRDRPLARRGERDAPRMGEAMRARGLVPDLVLCSPAARARATWELAAPRLGAEVPARYPDALYEAEPAALLAAIRATRARAATLLVVGHNPGLAAFALELAGPESAAKPLARLERKFPTAALAVLSFEGDWRQLAPGRARLAALLRPKDVED